MNDAVAYAASGPVIRSVGIRKDLRFYRSETYASYWFLSINSFLGKRGDSYDRFLIRVREMYEAVNIIFQVLTNITNAKDTNVGKELTSPDFYSFFNFLYKRSKTQLLKKNKHTSMESLIVHFKKYSEGVTVPKGLVYSAIEAPKGEFGVSLISDGTSKPYRCKIRTPAYHHMHVLPRMVQGHYMADLVTAIGSLDIVFGDVDR